MIWIGIHDELATCPPSPTLLDNLSYMLTLRDDVLAYRQGIARKISK